jgi:hypothetical protein
MDRLTEALSNLLPEEQVTEVAKAVKGMMVESEKSIRAEYKSKLDEAYKKLDEEVETAEAIAEQGYQQAYEIIKDLMSRLEEQREEYENAIEEGFTQAYDALREEKNKNNNIEMELCEEFTGKLNKMREFMIDKLDLFMDEQTKEIYEEAHHHIITDPRMVEHKVAVEKMADILGQYMSHDNYSHVSNRKLEEAQKAIEELKGQLRIVETRNVRLHGQNTKLNEQVREAKNLLTEAARSERKDRANRRTNASGRGQRAVDVNEQLITEFNNPQANNNRHEEPINEGNDELNDLLVLSGIYEHEEKVAKAKAEKQQRLNG